MLVCEIMFPGQKEWSLNSKKHPVFCPSPQQMTAKHTYTNIRLHTIKSLCSCTSWMGLQVILFQRYSICVGGLKRQLPLDIRCILAFYNTLPILLFSFSWYFSLCSQSPMTFVSLVSAVSPVIARSPSVLSVIEDQQVTLPCVLLAGNPLPERQWLHNYGLVRVCVLLS